MKTCRLLTLILLLSGVSTATASDWRLLDQLRGDHAALTAAEQDFHARRGRGQLVGNEAADYATYIARLYRRVAEDCVALAKKDIAIPPGLSCPEQLTAVLAPAPIDQTSEETLTEQTAVLDKQLADGMGEFDELLLREQERIKAATPHAADGGSGGGSGDSGGQDGTQTDGEPGGSEGQDGAPMEGAVGSGSAREGGAGSGRQQPGGSTRRPADIPDGSDDDVVARQLREAAEKETDPALKKKLWEEYRKYKQGTR